MLHQIEVIADRKGNMDGSTSLEEWNQVYRDFGVFNGVDDPLSDISTDQLDSYIKKYIKK